MKRTILILTCCMVAALGMAQGLKYEEVRTFVYDGIYYHPLTDSTVELYANQNACNPYPRQIVVPDTVEYDSAKYTVTRIADRALYMTTVTSVKLPPTVTSIGNNAFANCTYLTSFHTSESLQTIGPGAFFYCGQLASIDIPATVRTIDGYAFSQSGIQTFLLDSANSAFTLVDSMLFTADTSVLVAAPKRMHRDTLILPSQTRRLGLGAMNGTTDVACLLLHEGLQVIECISLPPKLNRLHIPASVTHIAGNPFCGQPRRWIVITLDSANTHYRYTDKRLTSRDGDTLLLAVDIRGDVAVPEGIKVLGCEAFRECDNYVTSITLPEGLLAIEEGAVCYTNAAVNIPSTVVKIAPWAFIGNKGLTDVVVPAGVKVIETEAFANTNITSVTLHDSVLQIKDSAFSTCLRLATVNLGHGVQSIGEKAFYCDLKITDIGPFPASLRRMAYGAFYGCKFDYAEFETAPDTIGNYGIDSPVVRFMGATPPHTYTSSLRLIDTVYVPCGKADDYVAALHGRPIILEDCDTIGIASATESLQITLAPNPAQGSVIVSRAAAQAAGPATVTLLDAAGHEVLRARMSAGQATLRLDLRTLPAGPYFVTLTTPSATATRRLILN